MIRRRPRLWFIVPVHDRLALAAICLRQLRRTCQALTADGIDASAVIVTDHFDMRKLHRRLGRNLLGFAAVTRDNRFLSRRFNDGIQLALDPAYNPAPADYVVPCGSDDWVDYKIFLHLPGPRSVIGFQRMSFVREDGQEISTTHLNYTGGSGIRIYPRELLETLPVPFRPADEDRERGCDTSILANVRKHHGDKIRVEHRHYHDRQIVDWKTGGVQLNPYTAIIGARHSSVDADPFDALAEHYPAVALEEMRLHYRAAARVAA